VGLVTNAAKKFVVEVNSGWCKGCSLCVGICPKQVYELSSQLKAFVAKKDECIGCHQCDNICPDLAITVKEASE
jgi:2-oxoglutarate ferredoxin oxidoreductase subunit delta